MESVTISVELTREDWYALNKAVQIRVNALRPFSRHVLALISAGFVILLAWLVNIYGTDISWFGFLGGMAFILIINWFSRRQYLKQYEPEDSSSFLEQHTITFDATGIRSVRNHVTALCAWPYVQTTTLDAERIYLWVDKGSAFVIPKRSLGPDLSENQFLALINQCKGGATGNTEFNPPSDSTPNSAFALPSSDGNVSVQQPISAMLKLLLFRNVHAESIPVGSRSLALLLAISLGFYLLVDRLSAGQNAVFVGSSIPIVGFYTLCLLIFAWLIAVESAPRIPFARALFITLPCLPLLLAVLAVLARFAVGKWLLIGDLIVAFYLLAYLAHALYRVTNQWQVRALFTSACMLGLLYYGSETFYWNASLWYSPEPDSEASAYRDSWSQSESLLFYQQDLIDKQISKINPSRSDMPAVYFVGFAGDGDQKVFAEEISLAADVVEKRYGFNDRTLKLVNDHRDQRSLPLGTVSGLRYGLKQLAAKMNVDRDVLFLSLSSHGSADASLLVENGSLPLQQLNAGNLRQALDESGIKWRVIVISACHAGSFIESLMNPQTIVITAAAADKTSFGCADDRDLTYFGEAFYRDALPEATTLESAFDQAKVAIAQREKAEIISASDPQAYFGTEISGKLVR